MKTTPILIATMILGFASLTGCAAANGPAKATQNQPTTSINETGLNTTSSTSPTSQSDSSNVATNTSGSIIGNSTVPTTSTPVSHESAKTLIKQQMSLAMQGKVYGIPYAAKASNLDSIEKDWGKPDSENQAGAGIYVSFAKHKAAFGFNKGAQIFDVRSFSPILQKITVDDVTSTLGQPGDVRTTADSTIYLYPAGPDFQLLFVFPNGSNGKMKTHVDHVSVFYPAGTIDSMALNFPQPTIVIDKAPSSTGNSFAFSVKNPPPNYHLAELEWVPTKGTPVVQTVIQAENSAKTGQPVPSFRINGVGQTHSFMYNSAMKGQTGVVKLVYQAVSGSAVIGESNTITLK